MSNTVYTNTGKTIAYDKLREKWEKKNGGVLVAHPAPTTRQQFLTKIEDIPVDTPSLINRDTLEKNINKILNSMDGFDGRIWNPPRAARVKGTGEEFIYDGDHSRALYRMACPDEDTMPAKIVDVERMEDVHNLFVQANCKGRTAMTAEQIFVHTFLGGDAEAKIMADDLQQTGLQVYCSAEVGGVAGDPNGYFTKIGGAKRVRRLVNHPKLTLQKHITANLVMKTAVTVLGDVLSCYSAWNRKDDMPAELLGAVTQLFATFPALMPPAGSSCSAFESYFINRLASGKKWRDVVNDLKDKGCPEHGTSTNYPEWSIASAMLHELNATAGKPGFMKTRLTGKLAKIYLG